MPVRAKTEMNYIDFRGWAPHPKAVTRGKVGELRTPKLSLKDGGRGWSQLRTTKLSLAHTKRVGWVILLLLLYFCSFQIVSLIYIYIYINLYLVFFPFVEITKKCNSFTKKLDIRYQNLFLKTTLEKKKYENISLETKKKCLYFWLVN